MFSRRFCRGVDFRKCINKRIVSDKNFSLNRARFVTGRQLNEAVLAPDRISSHLQTRPRTIVYRGISRIRNTRPQRITIGLWAKDYCRVLRGGGVLMSEVPMYFRLGARGERRVGSLQLCVCTGVPHLQENAPLQDPTVSLCLGS